MGRERKKKTTKQKKDKNSGYLPHILQSPLSPGWGLLLYTQLICPFSGNEGSWSAKLFHHSFLLTLFPSSSGGSPTVYSPSAYGCCAISPPPVAVFILTHKIFHLIFSVSCWGGGLREHQDVYLPPSQGQPITEDSILYFVM